MILTNMKILSYATQLSTQFNESTSALPIKVGFYLIKNKNQLIELAQEIEKIRMNILQENGTYDENTKTFKVFEDKVEIVNNKLHDLLNLEQVVQIYTFTLNDFKDDSMLTPSQMEAIMFMIEE